MDVRGERECKSCGARWSYFETGSVECPECGSLRSVGVGERATQTDAGGELDLTEARNEGADELEAALSLAVDACREYCRSRGFVAGGELLDLDDTYLAAQELRYAGSALGDAMRVSEDEERYALALLNGADAGERPPPEDVPESLRSARGLGYAAAIRAYRADVREFCDGQPPDPERGLLERLRDHAKRVRALDGDVPAADSERLVLAARDIADALRGDETAVERAREHLDQLG
ncbi:DUF7117 family protein [Halobacterium zhouii]|uniref:DUF7117 family protein n=1 Tax=Halobacterium zhouii TaxID=2902624 RepID=UPI001E4CDC0C|nr:TFIIB-type zinc ribbon-containing protein [Halobacterium zhouii]